MDEESDWDSEPELPPAPPKAQPAAANKPNGSIRHEQGDRRVDESSGTRRDGRRAAEASRASSQPDPGQAPAGDGRAHPTVSPRGGGRQPRPKQRRQEPRHADTRHTEPRESRQKPREQVDEEQPPFNFRPEANGGQRTNTRQKQARPPGRQQRAEYSVPTDTDTAGADSDIDPTPTSVPLHPGASASAAPITSLQSPRPRPRSAQTLPLLYTGDVTSPRTVASYDSFWREHRVIRDPVPFLGRPDTPIPPPIPPILDPGSDRDVALKPMASPGAVRHSSTGLDQQTALVGDPLTTDGPLVPLDGPTSGSGKGFPRGVEDGDDMETAALAVVVANYQFSQPDLRVLRPGDQNPSQLLGRYGRLSQRQLMKMWSEVLWVASVPVLIATTFFFALIRCLLETVVRPVALGPLQLIGDHLLKPAAVTVHDSLLLPAATLLANTLAALALVGRPLGQLLDALVRPLATLLGSCRLVQVSYGVPTSRADRKGAQAV